jgi:CSLREA domain-containing protein
VASIQETKIVFLTSTASLLTSAVPLTPTQTQPSTLAFTLVPAGTLTPTSTVPPVVIFLTSTKTPSPPNTPTFTSTPTPTPGVVNSLNDPGNGVCDASECTLREAIAVVSPGGTIEFSGSLSGGTITLATAELAIAKNLIIDGSALASRITISGNNARRVFNISSGYTVTLKSLVIANGYVNGLRGGGISNDGTLTVTGSLFSGNTAANQWGGAIANQGTLTVTNSTFSGNTATNGDGAAIVNGAATLIVTGSTFSGNNAVAGGAIRNDGTATITNSTFSGNSATPYWGGAIVNFGTLAVTNSTLGWNSSSNSGGGISNRNPGSLNLINTIITFSTGGDCVTDSALGGTSKNNLITNTGANACNLSNGVNGNVIGSNPNLGALASNGGSTQTFALVAGSPAIDAGNDSNCPSGDQRGATRPQGLHCDIGAYESSFSAPTPAGHTISSFSLNAGGNTVTVAGNSPVTVDYNYQVWGNSSACPGCNYQLVWGLENNWQYCSAWISPSPGDSPGLTGTGSQFTITAPATSGAYTIYSFSGQYADCTAAEAAYTSAGGTSQGTITVP